MEATDTGNKSKQSAKKSEEFILDIDPKPDKNGNLITGTEGPMVPSDSTRKMRLLQGDDND